MNGMTGNFHRVLIQHAHLGAQRLQNGKEQRHIADLRYVINAANSVHHQSGGDDRNGGIFRTADCDFTEQRTIAANNILIQNRHPLLLIANIVGNSIPAFRKLHTAGQKHYDLFIHDKYTIIFPKSN